MKQSVDNKTIDIEDVFIWPCGTWYYRYEYLEMKSVSHLSTDYKVLYFGTKEYEDFFEDLLGE